jgi:hypothetical protein
MKVRIRIGMTPAKAIEIVVVAVLSCLVLLWSPAASAQLLPPGPLSRSHAKLAGGDQCQRCHSEDRVVSAANCLSCHKELGARIRAGEGLHGRNYATKGCPTCHAEHRGEKVSLIPWPGGSTKSFDHSLTGWELVDRHRTPACTKCHKAKNSTGGTTYLGQKTACASCHEDDHDGRFGQSCQNCHRPTAFDKAVVPTDFDHNLANFHLRGKHLQVDCSKCHGTPPHYRGLEHDNCQDCHAKSPHKSQEYAVCATCHMELGWHELARVKANHPGASLLNGHSELACTRCHDSGLAAPPTKGDRCVSCHGVTHLANFGRSCERCHSDILWRGIPRRVALEAHRLTEFPLRSTHAQTACDKCHLPRFRQGNRWRLLEFNGCKNCHEDPHRGEFASRDGGECGQCHQDTGFYPTTFDIERHGTTDFPLNGRHLAVPCGRCHGDKRPVRDLHINNHKCENCHQSHHGDQFADEMSNGGCAHCHATRGWDTPYIQHDTWPRTGAHAQAKCTACHSPTEEDRRQGKGASYRGLPRDCSGCHDDHHAGQFRISEPVWECGHCHQSGEQFKIANFDHEKLTGHALKGRHLELECSKCHQPEQLEGGLEATRYRLGYRSCKSCHANPHRPTSDATKAASTEGDAR